MENGLFEDIYLPEANKAPLKMGWLEDDSFPFWLAPNFAGANLLSVSFFLEGIPMDLFVEKSSMAEHCGAPWKASTGSATGSSARPGPKHPRFWWSK